MRARQALILVLSCIAAAEETGDPIRYLRGNETVAGVLEQIGGLLRAADIQSVVLVFEQADFGERKRLPDEPDYRAQLPEWLESAEAWAAQVDLRVRVALTGSSKPRPVQAGAALLLETRRAYTEEPERWVGRLARFPKSKSGAIVYVSGPPQSRRFGIERLAWDAEPVVEALRRSGARLYVVMPEARFPDFLPAPGFVDLPKSWWRVPATDSISRRFHGEWAQSGVDCPSGYGVAAYARVAAATRGAYVFYPAAAGDWLDPCPLNVGLLTELLPRMPSAEDLAKAAGEDPLLREIAETTRRCAELEAFESDGFVPRREASRLSRLAGVARAHGHFYGAEAERLVAVGRAAEALGSLPRRSLAQLRYSIFLLETCAFHSAAWADAAEGIEEFAARGEGRQAYLSAKLHVSVWPEAHLALRDLIKPVAGLPLREHEETWTRFAKQQVAALPEHLRSRAARVVAAAEDVMEHEGLSPWGWMVYYSDIVTFAPEWVGGLKGGTRQRPDSEDAVNETPSDPPEAPGSGGAGPTTGG